MTDRVNALVVVLDQDIRIDDVESLMNAIRQLNHVASVEPNVSNLDSHLAVERARYDLRQQLVDVLWPKKL